MLSSVLLHIKPVVKVMIQIILNVKLNKNKKTFEGEVCVDKCCRGSKVLNASPNDKLECVASNHSSKWNPENLKLQLGFGSLNVRSWLFYLKRNLKVLVFLFTIVLIIIHHPGLQDN